MTSVLYVILAILVLSVLIVLHELGHFLMGKWLGFGIVEFAIGMGPVLFRKRGKKTDFALRAFLIGGSCQFYGEDASADTESEDAAETPEQGKVDRILRGKQYEPRKFPPEQAFNAQPTWKRLLVVAAGPLMNVLTAFVLAFCILLAFGSQSTLGAEQLVVVTDVEAGSSAEAAAFQKGDVLLSINGTAITDYDTFSEQFAAVREEEADFEILRGAELKVDKAENGDVTTYRVYADGGETVSLHAENIRDKRTGDNRIGVMLNILTVSRSETKYNVLTAAAGAFPFCWDMIKSVYGALFDIITGKACLNEVSGVIGTVSIMSETMETASAYGIGEVIYMLLYLGALISVNFAVVNLLPLPALDGGRLVFIVLEMIRRKPVPPEKEGMVHFIGMILLLALIVVLMVSDLWKCFRG